MARKKRRFIKHRSRTFNNRSLDRHHIFYQSRHWQKGALAELRFHPYCIVSIPKESMHRRIHEYLGDIPVPRESSAEEALKQLATLERYGAINDADTIEKRLVVLIAFFDCLEQPTANALKRQLAIVRKCQSKPP